MADPAPYHDRDGFIWFDGKLVPWRDANVHVLTHALHYASAVFEGERSYGGEIFKLREHTERLIASAKMLDFEIPYSAAEIDQACTRCPQGQQADRRLCAPDRLARQRDDGRLGSEEQDPSGRRRLELGLLLRHGRTPARHPRGAGPIPAPRSGDDPLQGQGHRPLHDLHHREAPRRARRLCRRHDARLARPRRRMHRGQYLLHQGRRTAYARSPIASSTASRARR